jgi:dehydrogenase/reductase SDR family protein 12
MPTAGFGPGGFVFGHLPSFTRLGYDCRKRRWPMSNWQFEGQRWLVTGASTGIGAEIARRAAAGGATVIAAARSADKLDSLAHECSLSRGRIEPLVVDLSLISSVAKVLEAVTRQGALDVLVNNVGVLLNKPDRTAEGHDLAFAANLLVPFQLTEQLAGRGLLEADASIITMSSGGMYNVPLQVDKLDATSPSDGVMAYARHKRAQVALNAHWRRGASGSRQYYVMHPGWVDTPGVKRSLPTFHLLLGPVLRDPSGGADTALWLAQTRPQQARDTGIWFDRALRPEHAIAGTDKGDDTAALVQFLAKEAGR